jgi:hypothetical protein
MFLSEIRVLNSPEQHIPNPDSDSSWQIPYFTADLEVIIQGIVYYLSTTIRNRDNSVNMEQNSTLRPLYEIDSDYTKGCILAKKLLEVPQLTFIFIFLFGCFSFFLV